MADYKKNVGLVGGVSLLISSITGPGITTIPILFQSGGWVFPTCCFIIIAFLSGLGSLFLLEAMTYFPGNEKFQLNVEFTVLVHQFYGRKWYYAMHVILYGSLQSFNIASIISAVQNFDSWLIQVVGGTCGLGLGPISEFYCVSDQSNQNSPFGDNYMLVTAGFFVFIALLIPLLRLDLNDNMILQFFSVAYLLVIIIAWVIICFVEGLKSEVMPAVGPDLTTVLGGIMFNYTLANTVPSWVNTKHKSVPIKKTIWWSIWFSTAMYLFVGWFAGAAFPMPGSNIISAIAAADDVSHAALLVNNIISITFPILVLLTSIPVSMIIVKLNLVSSKICSKGWATFWSYVIPFLIAIPIQTGDWVTTFANWTSLIFQSLCNFVCPFLVFLFLHKRNLVMQQSVIEELEFLELEGNLKRYRDDDEDFDYVYHLPHADLTKLGANRYNPFAGWDGSQVGIGGPVFHLGGGGGEKALGQLQQQGQQQQGLYASGGGLSIGYNAPPGGGPGGMPLPYNVNPPHQPNPQLSLSTLTPTAQPPFISAPADPHNPSQSQSPYPNQPYVPRLNVAVSQSVSQMSTTSNASRRAMARAMLGPGSRDRGSGGIVVRAVGGVVGRWDREVGAG